MKFVDAIAKLKTIEGTDDAVRAIENHANSLDREAETWKGKASNFESRVQRYEELVGASGENADKAIATLKEQLNKLTQDKSTLEETIKAKDAKIGLFELSSQVREMGINEVAFNKFVEGGLIPRDKVEIKEGIIKVGDQTLEEYSKGQGEWMAAALSVRPSDEKDNKSVTDTKFPKDNNFSDQKTNVKPNAGYASVLNSYSIK